MTISQRNIVCGLDEIAGFAGHNVARILSIVDPELADIAGLTAHTPARHVLLRFHDIIDPAPGMVMPTAGDVSTILAFGAEGPSENLLIHCHMGISRSSAAMVSILAQAEPEAPAETIFETLREIRPIAWPNSVMIAHADDLLGRGGTLVDALRRHYAHQIRREPRTEGWMTGLGRRREVDMASR